MEIFYVPRIDGDKVVLEPGESLHAVKVLRLRERDSVMVTDGRGNLGEGSIIHAHPKKCSIHIDKIQRSSRRSHYTLHMAIAPVKNSERTDWFLEKATEIGIDAFTPLICRFSERNKVNHSRLEKIAVSAIKQSQSVWLPVIHPEVPFAEFIRQPFEGDAFIAHCHQTPKPHLIEVVLPCRPILVLIGPEGDFSPEEVEMAKAAGFTEISLGNSRLRTETAALVACHTIALINHESITSI